MAAEDEAVIPFLDLNEDDGTATHRAPSKAVLIQQLQRWNNRHADGDGAGE